MRFERFSSGCFEGTQPCADPWLGLLCCLQNEKEPAEQLFGAITLDGKSACFAQSDIDTRDSQCEFGTALRAIANRQAPIVGFRD
jgi:hypothetical protein